MMDRHEFCASHLRIYKYSFDTNPHSDPSSHAKYTKHEGIHVSYGIMSSRKKQRKSEAHDPSPSTSSELREHGVYCKLPPEVTRIAERIGLVTNVSGADINQFLTDHLESGSPSDIANQAYNLKKLSEKTKIEGAKRHVKQEIVKGPKDKLTSKERKKLFDIKGSKQFQFETFVQMNQLWNGYIETIISDIKSPADELKLVRADYHGALFVVSAARNPALIGLKGIVVQETKNTFRILTSDNIIKGNLF